MNIHATPQGRAIIVDPDVQLSSLQVRTLMLCLRGDISFYDIVQEIHTETELRLIPQETIARDVANLVTRGFVVMDREN